jgi:hypothetical protein
LSPLARADEVHYHLGAAGRCDGRRKLFVFLLDDSGSVAGAGGNDPVQRRYAEARLAVRTLAGACRCGRELMAVLHWDAGSHDVPPVRLDRPGAGRLLDGLVQPDDHAGSSQLGPALNRAAALSQHPSSRRYQAHLVVLSDFQLLDGDPASVFARLNGFPGQVTAVVLGVEPDARLDADRVAVVPITAGDEPGALARALFGRLTEGRPGRRVRS